MVEAAEGGGREEGGSGPQGDRLRTKRGHDAGGRRPDREQSESAQHISGEEREVNERLAVGGYRFGSMLRCGEVQRSRSWDQLGGCGGRIA